MKKYLTCCFGFIFLFSGLLITVFNYTLAVVLYHVLVMSAITAGFAGLLFLLAAVIKRKSIREALIILFSGLFFFLLLLFYALVIGSNFFWHKTITVSILRNYTATAGDLLSVLPIQKVVILIALLLYLLCNGLLFFFVRPKDELITRLRLFPVRNGRQKKWLAGTVLLVLLVIAFHKPLIHLKRVMHLAEEPFLQFTLGAMWGNNNDIAFDKLRYENGLKDKACTDSIQPNPLQHNTIIILIDGLRADHLPMYGYKRNTAPFLDSLYNQKKLLAVQHAFSTSTNTIGGIAGLFFSKDWMDFGFNGLSLMKFFKKAGFTTYAFLTGFHRDWYGLSALYRESSDVYYESSDSPTLQNDDDLKTLEKINNTAIDNRSFVFIHLLSAHVIGKKNEPFRHFLPDKIGFGTDRKTALINNYDNGILQSDWVIRKIFEKLNQNSLLANSSVYILADHGELFGENGTWGHGDNIHEYLLTVPMLIYDEQQNWYKNLEAVTLKDLAPTIADRIGSPIPSCWEGQSMHLLPNNFTVNVSSVEQCQLPYGVLSKKDSTIELNIMDMQRTIRRTVFKEGNAWIDHRLQ